jgi:hypothetical protein
VYTAAGGRQQPDSMGNKVCKLVLFRRRLLSNVALEQHHSDVFFQSHGASAAHLCERDAKNGVIQI